MAEILLVRQALHAIRLLAGFFPKPVGSGAFDKKKLYDIRDINKLSEQRNEPEEEIPPGTAEIVEPFHDQHQQDPEKYQEQDSHYTRE